MTNDDNRTYRLNARLTEEEYAAFQKRFQDSGERFLSDYIRHCIFSEELWKSQALRKELGNTNYQIRKIGVLINQIAHKVNAGYLFSSGNEQTILIEFYKIEQMFTALENKIGGGELSH